MGKRRRNQIFASMREKTRRKNEWIKKKKKRKERVGK